jgi:hypothetical protein
MIATIYYHKMLQILLNPPTFFLAALSSLFIPAEKHYKPK